MWQPVWNGVEWVKFRREYVQVVVAVLLIIRNSKFGTEDCVSCLGTWVAVVAVINTWEHLLDLLCRCGGGSLGDTNDVDQRLSVVVECVTGCEDSVIQRVVFMLGGVWTEGLKIVSGRPGLGDTRRTGWQGTVGVLPTRTMVYIVSVAPPA